MKKNNDISNTFVDIISVHNISAKADVAISTNVQNAFFEEGEISPMKIGNYEYMPWGADNLMPYNILNLIQGDETVSTCHTFNAELMYGGGLFYKPKNEDAKTPKKLESFLEGNNISRTFYGQCLDLKHWGFTICLLILSKDRSHIAAIQRLHAMNCRFEVADKNGVINHIFYANWKNLPSDDNFQRYKLLNPNHPIRDLRERIKTDKNTSTFAMVSSIPGACNYYYPIPQYACIFRSRWFSIKKLIAISKENKMKNSAPIKYHVEINRQYWDNMFRKQHITDPAKKVEAVTKKKQEIIEFLTSAENSGKSFFSGFGVTVDGKEDHDVKITEITKGKEGGDWEQDLTETVNTICFAMGVHPNLVGSVPGKTQTNNSGSDKRELYTIAQLRQRTYHDIVLEPHRLICTVNGWRDYEPTVPLLMLTTLDEHKDVKPIDNEM